MNYTVSLKVKNFGRSGRTKYTHLLDQDTTQYKAAWMQDTAQSLKFHSAKVSFYLSLLFFECVKFKYLMLSDMIIFENMK